MIKIFVNNRPKKDINVHQEPSPIAPIASIAPDKVLERFLNWFDSRKRLAFILTIFIGFITHITMITEMIMSQDALWSCIGYFRPGQWETMLGRWGIEIIQRLNNFIAIPTISTISCIFIMAITSVFIVDLFNFKSKFSIVFTSLILVLIPTFTVTLLYIYTALSYCFNMLIAVLAVWFVYKFKYKKIGLIISTFCITLVLSIYQSYIGISIGLFVMISILDLLDKNKSQKTKVVLIDLLKGAIIVVIGAILYYVITKIILNIMHIDIVDYKSASEVSVLTIIKGLKTTIIKSYKDFLEFFFGDTIIYNTNYRREIFNGLLFVLLGIIFIKCIISNNSKEKKARGISASILIILLPICLNVIDLIVVGNSMYALTMTQMSLVIPFCFAIIEKEDSLNILKWGAILSTVCILGTYYLADNTSYVALKLTYNQAYSTTMRIMDRIEDVTDYKKEETPIVFGGIIGNNNYPRTLNIYNFTVGSVVNNVTFHGTYSGQVGTWQNFLRIFYGMDVKIAPENVYYAIVTSEEYKNMEIFPAQNSIILKDGIVVVKLSEDPPLPY